MFPLGKAPPLFHGHPSSKSRAGGQRACHGGGRTAGDGQAGHGGLGFVAPGLL